MKIIDVSIREKNQAMLLSNNLFKVGKVFKGKIIEIKDKFVILVTEDGQIISGKTDISLINKINKEIYLKVESVRDNKIILSPLEHEDVKNNYLDHNIEEILKMNGIKSNKSRIEVVKKLINFSMPIDKSNVEKSIRTYEKLIKLLNSDDTLEVYSLRSEIGVLDEDISNLIIDSNKNNNFIIDDLGIKNKYINYDDIDSYDVVKIFHLKEALNKAIGTYSLQDIVNGVIFLLKSNMKVSVNNLCNLFHILNGKNILEKDFNELEFMLMNDNESKYRNIKNMFNAPSNRLSIDIDNFSKEDLKKYFDGVKENLESLVSLAEKQYNSKEIRKKIRGINEKLNFLKCINNTYGFYYIPFKIDKYNFKENMFFLKKRRVNKDNKFKVFITLKTKRLELVKLICDMNRNNINIDFEINEAYIGLFKKEEYKLKRVLNNNGFDNIVICYNSNRKRNPIELLNSDNCFNYLFDVRV